MVPVSRVKSVQTLRDGQRQVSVRIFQGESRLVANNIFLGELEVDVPPRPAGEVSLDIRFTYDINGLLEAQVDTPMTGQSRTLVIENNPGVLTPQEIAERFTALQALKIHPRDQQANSALMARLERLYQECLGDVREHVGALAGHFAGVLERQDEREIREARQDISARLEAIESGY